MNADYLEERMEAIRASLEAAAPARLVTRRFLTLPNVPAADLERGQYTICSRGVTDFKNYNGREAMDGIHRMVLSCRIQLPESADALEVERAEFAMVGDVRAWLQSLSPGPLCCLVPTGFTQSGQLDAPYGWVLFELEMRDE